MSVDLRNIRNESRALLQNPHAIAVNQDRMGKQGRRIAKVIYMYSMCICRKDISRKENTLFSLSLRWETFKFGLDQLHRAAALLLHSPTLEQLALQQRKPLAAFVTSIYVTVEE